MRVGFLFNHYFTHQIPQTVPCAFELSKKYPDIEVIIACSSQQEMAFVKTIATFYPGQKCDVRLLQVPLYYRLIDPLVSKWSFGRKRTVLRHNLPFFQSLDALASPERTCLQLRTRFGIKDLKMIHIRHGAGDRQGGFDHKSGAFDLTLLPGQKYVDRLKELGLLTHKRSAVIGWPKFEVIRKLKREIPKFFDNNNPVVVYNPHFDQSVSSWQPSGIEVLEFFVQNSDYNLIFAPHVVLFKRSRLHRAFLPKKYCSIPNIHIDKGSSASSDMTYMLAADIYLGDVSSQVYEFLLQPRPCIFVNGHKVDWQDNPFYLHWELGQVVNDVGKELHTALEHAFATHPQYVPRQQEMFNYTFYSEPHTTAAERGADAIAGFIKSSAAI
jgi:hypothetical protein